MEPQQEKNQLVNIKEVELHLGQDLEILKKFLKFLKIINNNYFFFFRFGSF